MEIIRHTKPASSYYIHEDEMFSGVNLLGNGKLGAMVFGEVARERIALNNDTLWQGKNYDRKNPHAREGIAAVRRLLAEEKPYEALTYAHKMLYSSPKYINPYIPLCDLILSHEPPAGAYSDYDRILDLESGVCTVRYTIGDVTYTREIFVSAPDNVTVVRVSADKPRSVNLSAYFLRRGYDFGCRQCGDGGIITSGNAGEGGICFACVLKTVTEGGSVSVYNDTVFTENADAVSFIITSETSFRSEHYAEAAICTADNAAAKSYDTLKERHIKDHSALMRRVDLRLNSRDEALSAMPTDERLARFRSGGRDDGLFSLLYQFGRYLLLASSRAGSLASTLQGIWNTSYDPGWDCAYTLNINTQMNYWHAENTSLSECHMSLIDFITRLCENGRITAREIYGCRGSVVHHNSSIYADTDIEGVYDYCVVWPMGGAWLALHLWEHYEYTRDADFLRRAYPVMRDFAVFFTDYMICNDSGELITGPSLSPENSYITADGRPGSLCMAPAMDVQIIKTLFAACISAAKIIGTDADFRDGLEAALSRLPKDKIDSHGRIMEWQKEYTEAEPTHRHTSHLFGLYPGSLFTPDKTPELCRAAEKSLECRLDGQDNPCGWEAVWRSSLFSRLLCGQRAYDMLCTFIDKCVTGALCGRVNAVLPAFQIDGNMGFTAAVTEMLMQSHDGLINILPALPGQWDSGEVHGLRARGGFGVDIHWENRKPVQVTIRSDKGGACRLRFPAGSCLCCNKIPLGGDEITFNAAPGAVYIFK